MKVMSIYAHPADTITNCGGTLARHADRGDEVIALILTHGGRIHANKYAEEFRKENPDAIVTGAGLDEIVANKKAELQRAAEVIGISRLITLDLDDHFATVSEATVDRIAAEVAGERPDVVICDYPMNPAWHNPHTVATMMALAGLGRASQHLRNLDGSDQFYVKQIFLTTLPVAIGEGLSLHGLRNDVYVDITDVVGRKVEAMDQFVSQGYHGLFARKLIESANGEHGRVAGVNFAEAFYRVYNETHDHLPLTEAALQADVLTRHLTYSTINLRARFPVPE
ncbi:PIG-L family deacetylase [Micromonospora sp. DR5-3]|uniref:PIG-L deacetylase family protein n=1 Tax=unclassified Micromonospora TaxID=2617518 RepID=UPI0016529A98|nr:MULTISPECIES: PIG-L family deacetylase [unclassified Micromonospora]MCW3818902.1 PIG-L family deacetylase [Micromonospora sp. DR5-3]